MAVFGIVALAIVIAFCVVCYRRIDQDTEDEMAGKKSRTKRRFFRRGKGKRRKRLFLHGPRLRRISKVGQYFEESTTSTTSSGSGDNVNVNVKEADAEEDWLCPLPPRDQRKKSAEGKSIRDTSQMVTALEPPKSIRIPDQAKSIEDRSIRPKTPGARKSIPQKIACGLTPLGDTSLKQKLEVAK